MSGFLGIDIGTSKTAAVVVDAEGTVLASCSRVHGASVGGLAEGHVEQEVDVLLNSAREAVAGLPLAVRTMLTAVGVSGQMHGVVLVDREGSACGRLVNWQDRRCDAAFLARLADATGHRLRTGYGCATLAWLQAHGGLPKDAVGSCTIHDLLVCRLCGCSRPVCDPTNAASWGLFDLASASWDSAAVASAGLPDGILPDIVPSGSITGELCGPEAASFGLPAGIPVCVALGDNQASLLATLRDAEHELALTLGTGGQLSSVGAAGARPEALSGNAPYEYRPYPGGRLLCVASSLCGGSAWKWLADTVQRMLQDTGRQELVEDELYALLNEAGKSAKEELTVHPHFLGERHDPALRGSIEGIDLANCSLAALARGLARGIVANLQSMLPERAHAGRTRVVLSGNALRRNPLLRQMAGEVLQMETVLSDRIEEAAVGAAILAGGLCRNRVT